MTSWFVGPRSTAESHGLGMGKLGVSCILEACSSILLKKKLKLQLKEVQVQA